MIKIGIIGTGGIANWHARAFKDVRGAKIVAACDVDKQRADTFCENHAIPASFESLEDMLASTELDAVVNATSDVAHAPTSLTAIGKGLHILCEKPLATNYTDARAMARAAGRKKVINMVNFSYRTSSAVQRAPEMVLNGDLGEIVHFDACSLQSWLVAMSWGNWRESSNWLWRLSTNHGSLGALGDIGVHIIDFATFAAGKAKNVQCRLKTFEKIKGKEHNGYRLDANDSAVISLELANGALGTIHTTRWATGYCNTLQLRIHGTKGAVRIDLDTSYTSLGYCRGKDIDTFSWKEVKCGKTPTMQQRFLKSVKSGQNDQPDFARGAEIQKIMDACKQSSDTGKIIKL